MKFPIDGPAFAATTSFLILGWSVGYAQESADSGPEWVETIVHTTIRPPNWDIYLYEDRGEAQRRLTDNPALEYNAVFSPDGRWVVYTSEVNGNADLYALGIDSGSESIRLTQAMAMDDAAAFAPNGRQLAFVSSRDGDADVFIMPFMPDDPEVAEAAAINLTHRPGGDFNPAISPDGERIAYSRQDVVWVQGAPDLTVRHTDVYVMDVDGSDSVRLTEPGAISGSPAWSDDGEHVYYYRMDDPGFYDGGYEREEGLEIRRIATDGTGDIEVANFGISPTLARDGRVAFVRPPAKSSNTLTLRTGHVVSVQPDGSAPLAETDANEICLAPSSDRSSTRIVCHAPGPTTLPSREAFTALRGGPAILAPPGARRSRRLADGRTLAMQGVLGGFPALLPNGDIVWSFVNVPAPLWVSRIDGTEMRPILEIEGAAVWGATVARQGGLIFVGAGAAANYEAANAIWRLRLDGGDAVRLTSDSTLNEGLPSASADGTVVVFRVADQDSRQVYAMDAEGGNRRQLSSRWRVATMPAVSPDGEWVVYTTTMTPGRDYNLWIERVDGTEGRYLEPARLEFPDRSMHPRFSPDGRWVVFTSDRGRMPDEWPLTAVPQPYGDLWAVPVAGGDAIRLTDDKWEDGPSDWAFVPPAALTRD